MILDAWHRARRVGASVLGGAPGELSRATLSAVAIVAAGLADAAGDSALRDDAHAWDATTTDAAVRAWSSRLDARARPQDLPASSAITMRPASVTLTWDAARDLVARRVPDAARERALAAFDAMARAHDDARREVEDAVGRLGDDAVESASIGDARAIVDALDRSVLAWWDARVTGARASRWPGVPDAPPADDVPPADDAPPTDDAPPATRRAGAAAGAAIALALGALMLRRRRGARGGRRGR